MIFRVACLLLISVTIFPAVTIAGPVTATAGTGISINLASSPIVGGDPSSVDFDVRINNATQSTTNAESGSTTTSITCTSCGFDPAAVALPHDEDVNPGTYGFFTSATAKRTSLGTTSANALLDLSIVISLPIDSNDETYTVTVTANPASTASTGMDVSVTDSGVMSSLSFDGDATASLTPSGAAVTTATYDSQATAEDGTNTNTFSNTYTGTVSSGSPVTLNFQLSSVANAVASVPEPSSFSFLALVTIFGFGFRRYRFGNVAEA